MSEFIDTKVSLPEGRFESTYSKEDTHRLIQKREDETDLPTGKTSFQNWKFQK